MPDSEPVTENGRCVLGRVGYWPLRFKLIVTRFSDMWRVELARATRNNVDQGLCSVQLFDDGTLRVRRSNGFGQRETAHDYEEP